MKASFERGEDRSVVLYLVAETELESIAMAAWTRQSVTNPQGVDLMPCRYCVAQESSFKSLQREGGSE